MEAKKIEKVQLGPGRVSLTEHKNPHYTVYVSPETSVKNLQDPNYWSIYAEQFRQADRMTVIWEDMSQVADLLVLQSSRTWTKVHVLNHYQLEKADMPDDSDIYEAYWAGPRLKFCVKRKSDGERVKENFEDKATAISWMREHEKV